MKPDAAGKVIGEKKILSQFSRKTAQLIDAFEGGHLWAERYDRTLEDVFSLQDDIMAYTKAVRLNPLPPSIYFSGLGMSYSLAGQHEEGIKWCEKAVRQEPDSYIDRIFMIAVYSMAGRFEDARSEVPDLLRINPNFSLAAVEKRAKYKYKDKIVEALRKANLPE